MLNTNPNDYSNGQSSTPNDSLHDENMNSYMDYVDQINNDSNELSFEQLQSYFTVSESEQNRMWDENEPFCKQCYQQGG